MKQKNLPLKLSAGCTLQLNSAPFCFCFHASFIDAVKRGISFNFNFFASTTRYNSRYEDVLKNSWPTLKANKVLAIGIQFTLLLIGYIYYNGRATSLNLSKRRKYLTSYFYHVNYSFDVCS